MQSQIERFNERAVNIVAISVDAPEHSTRLIHRLGLSFTLASDPQQQVVKSFGVQNPDTQELALHAVYLIDRAGTVFYRKVARRRPTSEELLDAIDAFRGTYPVEEPRKPRPPRSVAWPTNNFQTLLAMSAQSLVPATLDRSRLDRVLNMLSEGKTDDSLIAFKALAAQSNSELGAQAQEQLLAAAAWLTRQRFIADNDAALKAGEDLASRLRRVAELEALLASSTDVNERDEVLQTLGRARGGLARARATVRNNQGEWNLDYAQGMLRSYREVGRVMSQPSRAR